MKSRKIIDYIRQPLEVRLLRYFLIIILVIPSGMLMVWAINPGTEINLFILNKTVSNLNAQNRSSLFWILNNENFHKPNGERYAQKFDYYGFFPGVEHAFFTRDIHDLSTSAIDSLADTLDAAYFLDTYGVYANDYYSQKNYPNPLLYGGLYKKDLDLLSALKARGKLVITEFNILGESTPPNARKRFLDEFKLKWSGWSGRYFDSLDSLKGSGIPAWIFDLQRQKSGKAWPYKRSGMILVNASDDIIVLESGSHLQQKVPWIETRASFAERFNLPEKVNYISWFDIVFASGEENLLAATFHLPVNSAGEALLAAHGLSAVFPAILAHEGEDYQFYYFAGDFSDNRTIPMSAYFGGVHWLQTFFYNPRNVLDRRAFFWQYYRPLMTSILRLNING